MTGYLGSLNTVHPVSLESNRKGVNVKTKIDRQLIADSKQSMYS